MALIFNNQQHKIDLGYKNKLSFMNTSELLDEKESVWEMCKYVSPTSPFHIKKHTLKTEFISRGLACLSE